MSQDYAQMRRSPRRQFERSVSFLYRGDYYMTEARQLGEGGMMILSPVDLPQDARLLVNFIIPGGGPLIIQAQVLYRISQEVGFRYGLKFLAVKFEQRRWIRNYVALKTEMEAKKDSKLNKILDRTNSGKKANFAA